MIGRRAWATGAGALLLAAACGSSSPVAEPSGSTAAVTTVTAAATAMSTAATTAATAPVVVDRDPVAAVLAYRDVQRRILAGETVTEDDLAVGVGDGHHALEALRGEAARAEADRPAYDAAHTVVLDRSVVAGVDPASLTSVGEIVADPARTGEVVAVCVRNPPSSPARIGTVVGALVVLSDGAQRGPQVAQFLETAGGLDGAPGVALTTAAPAVGVRCGPDGTPTLAGP